MRCHECSSDETLLDGKELLCLNCSFVETLEE